MADVVLFVDLYVIDYLTKKCSIRKGIIRALYTNTKEKDYINNLILLLNIYSSNNSGFSSNLST